MKWGSETASGPFSADDDLVDLVLGLYIRCIPGGLVDDLLGKDGASTDQVIEGAEPREKFKTTLRAYNDLDGRPSHNFNGNSLRESGNAERFKLELRNKFSLLSQLSDKQ